MDRNELENRTKKFHISVIRLCNLLPKTTASFETAKQLIRSAGSVGANYCATKRAKSTNDFLNKLKIIIEEADESKVLVRNQQGYSFAARKRIRAINSGST